eukprot:2945311-Prymnesium_polylepis.1
MVLALRLFSSSVHRTINWHLRVGCNFDNPHPYPTLVICLVEALHLLRKHGAHAAHADGENSKADDGKAQDQKPGGMLAALLRRAAAEEREQAEKEKEAKKAAAREAKRAKKAEEAKKAAQEAKQAHAEENDEEHEEEEEEELQETRTFWRACQDMDIGPKSPLAQRCASEMGFMTMVLNENVAASYATIGEEKAGHQPAVLMKLSGTPDDPMPPGASISAFSIFPDDDEYVYAPGTFLEYKG